MTSTPTLTAKQGNALADARTAASEAARQTGFWPSLLVAEWVLASQYGDNQLSNNPFRTRYAPHVHRWGYYVLPAKEFVLRTDLEDFRREHPDVRVVDERLGGAILQVKADQRFACYPSLTEAFIDRARMYQFVAPYCWVWQACKDQISPVRFFAVVCGADEHGKERAEKIERLIAELSL